MKSEKFITALRVIVNLPLSIEVCYSTRKIQYCTLVSVPAQNKFSNVQVSMPVQYKFSKVLELLPAQDKFSIVLVSVPVQEKFSKVLESVPVQDKFSKVLESVQVQDKFSQVLRTCTSTRQIQLGIISSVRRSHDSLGTIQ